MKTRKVIYADEGKILTNGEAYGRIVHLAIGANTDDWYEITEEEYSEILAKEEENLPI